MSGDGFKRNPPAGDSRWRPQLFLIAAALPFMLFAPGRAGTLPPIQTVFVIMMENQNWADLKTNSSAAYILGTLLPMSSYCEAYYDPPGIHPSEPNYLWLEAGTNFGIADDREPSVNHQNTTNHLVTLLQNTGISWKTYQEDISGTNVPLSSNGSYAARHNPFVYFDDITGTNDPNYPYGIAHIRPCTELGSDLAANTVARYNFITPNLCDDMHDACAPYNDGVLQGDRWLSNAVPLITNSAAYQNGGAVFITWDEGEGNSDGPIGMIVLSKFARGGGYHNGIYYTHGSTLRTVQEIFGVAPFLGDAANATGLSDLFCRYDISASVSVPGGSAQLTVTGVIPGKTNIIETSTNLTDWTPISTNVAFTNSFNVTNVISFGRQFYRAVQLP